MYLLVTNNRINPTKMWILLANNHLKKTSQSKGIFLLTEILFDQFI